jgi:transmembrane sensor
VRLDGPQTLLAVYHGAVEARAQTGVSVIVPAGQQTRLGDDGPTALEPADPAREAWTRGLLVAQNIPLAELVQELRRHYPGHLSLAPEAASLRVFGSYPANDPERTLAMLESVISIRVRRPLPWWISVDGR